MSWYRWDGDNLELRVRVQPRAPKDAFVEPDPSGEYYRVRLKAPPVEGKGNLALRRFIAEAFGVAASHVEILSGEQARYKRLRIQRPRTLPLPVGTPPCSH
ncbi:hypothetical protein SAMN05421644_10183 [Allochromatium warmingii]|uniref:UPF0235 protein SAMN05421644_10183 n=1 Tax=Allochromatium warmingii TaxID=61595 RepID=A0A1H3AS09_ALLWA|nr:DUF167 family protein [Allochromatium warmingii]SDX32181.1 hypothetical protein SAMN05421644_10183 [Allochromatium warmingii]